MSVFGESLRERSKVQEDAVKVLFDSEKFAQDPKIQAMAVVAKTTANFLYVAADIVDYLRTSETMDEATTRRETYLERANAIRHAAVAGFADGNYSEFDRLTKDFGPVASADGEPTGSPGE